MAFPYVRHQANWQDGVAGGTPITETALDTIEAGIDSLSNVLELVDAKGDLLVGSAADTWIRKAVGADNAVLAASAGDTGGVIWTKVGDAHIAAAGLTNAAIAAAAAISVSKLAAGSAGQVLKTVSGIPAWSGSFATTLPGSPVDGDEAILVDSTSAPTYAWRFRYVSAKSSNKWQFIGGSPGFAAVATLESTTSTTYVALTTAGPVFALPVAGDYLVSIGFHGDNNTNADGGMMSYDIGGTAAVDGDRVGYSAMDVDVGTLNVQRMDRKLGLTAVTLTSKYRASVGGTARFGNRFMAVTPIAIGG